MTEKLPGDELVARMYVEALVEAGKAQELMEAYSDHNQSCHYVHGIVRHVAYEGLEGQTAQEFARNLLEDWSK